MSLGAVWDSAAEPRPLTGHSDEAEEGRGRSPLRIGRNDRFWRFSELVSDPADRVSGVTAKCSGYLTLCNISVSLFNS